MMDYNELITGFDCIVMVAVCERTGLFGSSVSVKSMSFSSNNSWLVITTSNKSIKVFDLRKSLANIGNVDDKTLKSKPLKGVWKIKES